MIPFPHLTLKPVVSPPDKQSKYAHTAVPALLAHQMTGCHLVCLEGVNREQPVNALLKKAFNKR